jgi:hypothetical protein
VYFSKSEEEKNSQTAGTMDHHRVDSLSKFILCATNWGSGNFTRPIDKEGIYLFGDEQADEHLVELCTR